jgi:hypothetical protein
MWVGRCRPLLRQSVDIAEQIKQVTVEDDAREQARLIERIEVRVRAATRYDHHVTGLQVPPLIADNRHHLARPAHKHFFAIVMNVHRWPRIARRHRHRENGVMFVARFNDGSVTEDMKDFTAHEAFRNSPWRGAVVFAA